MKHWRVKSSGGDGFQIEDKPIGSDPLEDFCKELPKTGMRHVR